MKILIIIIIKIKIIKFNKIMKIIINKIANKKLKLTKF
jgi:hypothetical protein